MISGLLAVAMVLLLNGAIAADTSFVLDSITRKLNLANAHGLENIVAFKATRKDAGASSFHVTLLPESKGGRVVKIVCNINNDIVRDTEITKSAEAVSVKIPVPTGFSSGTIACQSYVLYSL